MKSLDPTKSLRKNSCDNNNTLKDLTHFLSYSFNPDVFSHKSPKWLKIFYIGPCYFHNRSKEDTRIIFTNNSFISKSNRSKILN